MSHIGSDSNLYSVKDVVTLAGRVAIITGGAGLMGGKHAEAIAEMGGCPVLFDIDASGAAERAQNVAQQYNVQSLGLGIDITKSVEIERGLNETLKTFGRIDILINNAANNPKVEKTYQRTTQWSRLENFPLKNWQDDLDVGLTGAFLCSQIIGSEMANRGKGVILNIASDLAVIAPDQRIYRNSDISENQQPVKPVSYSVVKTGLIGLTRYLATYWADKGVRVNAVSPGGVHNNEDDVFVERLSKLIPMGRMAHRDEYKAAVVFLVSDMSSYMTGANLVLDGGRSVW